LESPCFAENAPPVFFKLRSAEAGLAIAHFQMSRPEPASLPY